VISVDEQAPSIDIRHYLRVLVKRRYQLIGVSAAIIAVATVASFMVPKVYEATTTVSIEKNYLNVLMSDMAVDSSVQNSVQGLSVIMTGRSMLLQVLSGLGVDIKSKNDVEIEKLVRYFQRNTKIQFDGGRSGRSNMEIFTVTYRDRDPKFARDYVNALVGAYVAASAERTRDVALGANKFIYEQMDLYKKKIDDTEAALERRKRQPGAVAEARLLSLRKKYQDLLTHYTENYPEAVRLRAEIASVEEEIQRERPGWHAGESANSGPGEQSIADLQRDRDAYRRIYESLVASLGKSEVSAKVESQTQDETFNVLEPAVLPTLPASKPRWKLLLLSLFGGIAGGVASVILLDMTDKTIKNAAALKALGLRVVALIPRIESAQATAAQRRKDLLVYGAAGAYAAGVLALIVMEYLTR
jgi:succinoglycan biosynthesis transport protein ExoP